MIAPACQGSLRDARFWALAGAALLLFATFAAPSLTRTGNGVDVLAIVDITGSMNVRDVKLGGRPASRLDLVKSVLREALASLPCPARFGLGVFSERQPFLLFEPVDVCAAFDAIEGTLAGLDWRMGWEGDSHVAMGLYRAIDMARDVKADLAFFTDGHEAPPLPASGGPAFEGERGAVNGLIMGVGEYALSPIPKFDDDGREIGFYGMNDVLQENRFGPPPKDAESREGYNPRNAPFGGQVATGSEHLSSVREPYLRSLAEATGLAYRHLSDAASFVAALKETAKPRPVPVALDLRPFLASGALALLLAAYAWASARAALRRWFGAKSFAFPFFRRT
jgi:mxaL protein